MQIYVIDDKKPGLYGSVVSSPTKCSSNWPLSFG
jgi:hypothetical protein